MGIKQKTKKQKNCGCDLMKVRAVVVDDGEEEKGEEDGKSEDKQGLGKDESEKDRRAAGGSFILKSATQGLPRTNLRSDVPVALATTGWE